MRCDQWQFSAKLNSDALEELNVIVVFSCDDAVGLPEMIQFFEALRKNDVALAIKRTRIAAQEFQSVFIGSGHETTGKGSTVAFMDSAEYKPKTDIEVFGVDKT